MAGSKFRDVIYADLYRYCGERSIKRLVYFYIFRVEFRFIFWLRFTRALRSPFFLRPVHYISRYVLYRMRIRYGINIPYNTSIQPGFYIGHCGNINVNPGVVIGRNCNISSGVTIGYAARGKKRGVPVIGDNIYIGPGAKLIGQIIVGDNSAIGANSVLTRDVPENAVMAGVPGEVVSMNGSEGYITNKA